MEVAKVRKQGINKIVTIPKNSTIEVGKYVKIIEIMDEDDERRI